MKTVGWTNWYGCCSKRLKAQAVCRLSRQLLISYSSVTPSSYQRDLTTMPSIELRTRQSLALTPRLQQSVRLLQLSSLEFQQELRTALDTNPFLEYDSSETEDVALATATSPDEATPLPAADTVAPAEADALPADAGSADTMESAGQDDMGGDMGGEFSGDYSSRSSARQNGDSEGSDPAEWARSQPTLHEQL